MLFVDYSRNKFGKEEKSLLEEIDPQGFGIQDIRGYRYLCQEYGVESKITDEKYTEILKDALDTENHFNNLGELFMNGDYKKLHTELSMVNPLLLLSKEKYNLYQKLVEIDDGNQLAIRKFYSF